VAEAYWYLAGKLRAELPVRRSAERELLALNTAYAALAVAEQRQAYDATVSRVMEIRRERAERARARTERPLLTRLFGTPESPQRNSYELLRIDPSAEPPLIARAYSILRTLHLREGAGEAPKEYLTELTTALTTLLDGGSRAAYDESLKAAAAARASSVPAAELGESEAGSGGGSADARKAGGLG
jgi:DnaJ-class molecular chaperone